SKTVWVEGVLVRKESRAVWTVFLTKPSIVVSKMNGETKFLVSGCFCGWRASGSPGSLPPGVCLLAGCVCGLKPTKTPPRTGFLTKPSIVVSEMNGPSFSYPGLCVAGGRLVFLDLSPRREAHFWVCVWLDGCGPGSLEVSPRRVAHIWVCLCGLNPTKNLPGLFFCQNPVSPFPK
uniref:Uncharacterized protein n=1 Tax=Oryzias melastigma TaxID=30732 RepID=A0A3B3D8E3_ORYME